ncbi:MAG TPA: FUSC family protein [Solirubrobacteraceae bacterium]
MRTTFIQVAELRVRGHLWPILQTAVAAVGAWYLAVLLGVEHRPAFASIAAVISLGAAFGERRQRAVQLIGGVMLGIVIADLLVRAIGSGIPQIGLLVVLAMVAAVILGGEELLVGEAAVSAILVATLSSTPTVRLLDVLIGGGVALAVTTLLFPPDPVLGVARATSSVFGALGVVLRDSAAALAAGDVRHGEAAIRAADNLELYVDELRRAVVVGSDTARWAPLRRASRPSLQRYARTVSHAELAARSARILARNVLSYVRSGRPAQSELADGVRELGLAAWELPAQFDEPWRGGDVLRMALQAASLATASTSRQSDIALIEIAGQVRSMAIDIVKASEASETDHSALGETPTEELLAALPLPEPGVP